MVVEVTSGNMGVGLGMVCAAMGHPLVAIISAGSGAAPARLMQSFGARVIVVEQVDGEPGQVTGADLRAAAKLAQKVARNNDGFYVDQFNDVAAITAHEATGDELLQQLGHPVDGFAACVGTGCTFQGIARALRAVKRDTVCVAVEPEGNQPLAGKLVTRPRHGLMGAGYGQVPSHWDPRLMDRSFAVSDADIETWRRRLADREGLYVGATAAANVFAAVRLLGELSKQGEGAVVATVLCDSGQRTPPDM